MGRCQSGAPTSRDLMEIVTQTEIILREAGYTTFPDDAVAVVRFECEALIGFLHIFSTAQELLRTWRQVQTRTLERYQPAIRLAGDKAWNIYCLFLCQDASTELSCQIERIEEDFTLTRKIARSGIKVPADLRWALLPLLPVSSQAAIAEPDYLARLQSRLKEIRPEVIKAFLGATGPAEVARILADQ